MWVADLIILHHGLKGIKDLEQLGYWAEKLDYVNYLLVIAHQEQLDASRKRSVACEQNGEAPTPQTVSTTALKDAAPVKPPAKPADVIERMDSDDIEALEFGTADNAVPSRNDGAYGNDAVGGDDNGDDADDVGKDDDTLILAVMTKRCDDRERGSSISGVMMTSRRMPIVL